jgi:two-component system invasion response regulator UvrY
MRQRVLLAENDSGMARALMRQLSCAFEVVAVVASGEDLIDRVSKLSPDAVLADVGLDGLNGISATVEIRRRFPTIPIVLVTASDVDSLRDAAIAAGASALLRKDDLTFVDVLHQLLPRAQ